MRIAAYLNIQGVKFIPDKKILVALIYRNGNFEGFYIPPTKKTFSIACYFQVYGVKISYWFSSNMETFEHYMESYDPNWKSDYTVLGSDIKRTMFMVPPKERWHEINGLQRIIGISSRFINIGNTSPYFWTESDPIKSPTFDRVALWADSITSLKDKMISTLGISDEINGEPTGNSKSGLYRFFIPAHSDIVDTYGFRNPYAGLNLPPPKYPNIAESENAYGPYRNYVKFSNKKYRVPRKLKKKLKKNPKVIPEFNIKEPWRR